MTQYPEYSILNALSYGSELKLKNSMPFEENCSLIIKSLEERNFVILFPFYWTHSDVANFSNKYQNKINHNDLEWYLLELRNVLNKRKNDEIHWIERVNFFHSIACTRFLNENQVDNEKLIHIMEQVSGFEIEKPKFNNLVDISSYNFLCLKGDIDIESSIVTKVLHSFEDKELLMNYAKYQIFYYGSPKNCIDKMKQYVSNDDMSVIVPHTLLGLKWLIKYYNFPLLDKVEIKDLLSDLTNKLSVKTKKIVTDLTNE